MNYIYKTLSGLLLAGADQAPQDLTTPLLIETSIRDNCVFNLNKNERIREVFKERMKLLGIPCREQSGFPLEKNVFGKFHFIYGQIDGIMLE